MQIKYDEFIAALSKLDDNGESGPDMIPPTFLSVAFLLLGGVITFWVRIAEKWQLCFSLCAQISHGSSHSNLSSGKWSERVGLHEYLLCEVASLIYAGIYLPFTICPLKSDKGSEFFTDLDDFIQNTKLSDSAVAVFLHNLIAQNSSSAIQIVAPKGSPRRWFWYSSGSICNILRLHGIDEIWWW